MVGVDLPEVGLEAVGGGDLGADLVATEEGLAVIEDAVDSEGAVVAVAREVDGALEGVEEGTEVHKIISGVVWIQAIVLRIVGPSTGLRVTVSTP